MRQLIEITILFITFSSCYHYQDWPEVLNDKEFVKNFAFSTASACIFYLATVTIPCIIKRVEHRLKSISLLIDIIECCIAYDIYFNITAERIYVGYGSGYTSFFSNVNIEETRPYKFSGRLSLVRRSVPHQMGTDFAYAILGLIEEICRLEAPLSGYYQTQLENIAKTADRFIAHGDKPQKNNLHLQRQRGSVWKYVDRIINQIDKTIFLKFFFYSKVTARRIKIKKSSKTS